jgi:hypothetical protein
MGIAGILACVKMSPDGGISMANARNMAVGKMVATSVIRLVIELTLARSKMVAGGAVYVVIGWHLASGKMNGNTLRRLTNGPRHVPGRSHAASLDWARNSPTVQQPET